MMESLEDKLQELLHFAKKHGLMEMECKDGEVKIAFRRSPTGVTAAPAMAPSASAEEAIGTPQAEEVTLVRAPMVGTFRRSVTKGRPPLVMVGNHVKPGDSVGVV